jgi:mono/diheme cytochrome c family protein
MVGIDLPVDPIVYPRASPPQKNPFPDYLARSGAISMHLGIKLQIIAITLAVVPQLAGAEESPLTARGGELVAAKCAQCHATARTGESPHSAAPPFRTLSRKYPIEALAESLAEGISVGHSDMPEFVFEADDIAAILAYLDSIQER